VNHLVFEKAVTGASQFTRAHHTIYLTEQNRSKLASLKFPYAFILASIIVAL